MSEMDFQLGCGLRRGRLLSWVYGSGYNNRLIAKLILM
jgi:hypothetical protein